MISTLPARDPAAARAKLLRGPAGDPWWGRPALLVLLAGTAVLYLWGLGRSGWANSFYAAAVQAGSTSWKAFFFGSSDAANAITVDKTPAALWPMDLAARIFGLNTWSILVPQALMGVGSVAALYAAARRVAGLGAGLGAGAVLALTPVAALMFRFNNPDALLVLLMTLGAYAMVRAQERAATSWLIVAGVCLGFGFLAKMMQVLLVLPAFALVYLLTAPTPVQRRIRQLLAGGGAMIAAAGWWVLAVALTPASSRPYIGGSQHNSVLELALGYNGFGRLTGDETGGLGNLNQEAGWNRLFASEMGGQISWLLPAALILLAAGIWVTWRRPRTDALRASLALWGGWLVVTGAVFSFSQGILHPYYTVALAPAIGALVGIGGSLLWARRSEAIARLALSVAIGTTAWWSYTLLDRTPDWYPALRGFVLGGGLIAAVVVLVAGEVRRVPAVAGVLAIAACLAGPAAYAAQTASTAHTGAIPSAGPGQGGFGGGGPRGGFPGGGGPGNRSFPGGNRPGTTNGGTSVNGGRPRFGGWGGMSLLSAASPGTEVTALLRKSASSYTWAAATVGSNSAAGYQLATRLPVMALGGFNGTDPAPTPARFKELVAAGKIHYFIGSGGGMGARGDGSGSDEAQQIASWVSQNYQATTVDGVTLYDLTAK